MTDDEKDDARILAAFTGGRQVPASLTELNKRVHLPAARRDAALARLVARGELVRTTTGHAWGHKRVTTFYHQPKPKEASNNG
jgi:hypothetical protein